MKFRSGHPMTIHSLPTVLALSALAFSIALSGNVSSARADTTSSQIAHDLDAWIQMKGGKDGGGGGGGGMDGGGGVVTTSSKGSAWFVAVGSKAPKPISACLLLAEDFPLSRTEVRQALESGFQTWDTYIQRKKIIRGDHSESSFHFRAKLKLAEDCQGEEELRIVVGVVTPEILRIRKTFGDAIMFASRLAYDPQTGKSTGLLWFAPHEWQQAKETQEAGLSKFPNWKSPNAFSGGALHEIGHTFGIGHHEGTIMRAGITQLIGNTFESESLLSIDHERELHVMKRWSGAYTERLIFQSPAPGFAADVRLLAEWLGLNAYGQRVQMTVLGQDHPDGILDRKLRIQVGHQTHEFQLMARTARENRTKARPGTALTEPLFRLFLQIPKPQDPNRNGYGMTQIAGDLGLATLSEAWTLVDHEDIVLNLKWNPETDSRSSLLMQVNRTGDELEFSLTPSPANIGVGHSSK